MFKNLKSDSCTYYLEILEKNMVFDQLVPAKKIAFLSSKLFKKFKFSKCLHRQRTFPKTPNRLEDLFSRNRFLKFFFCFFVWSAIKIVSRLTWTNQLMKNDCFGHRKCTQKVSSEPTNQKKMQKWLNQKFKLKINFVKSSKPCKRGSFFIRKSVMIHFLGKYLKIWPFHRAFQKIEALQS